MYKVVVEVSVHATPRFQAKLSKRTSNERSVLYIIPGTNVVKRMTSVFAITEAKVRFSGNVGVYNVGWKAPEPCHPMGISAEWMSATAAVTPRQAIPDAICPRSWKTDVYP